MHTCEHCGKEYDGDLCPTCWDNLFESGDSTKGFDKLIIPDQKTHSTSDPWKHRPGWHKGQWDSRKRPDDTESEHLETNPYKLAFDAFMEHEARVEETIMLSTMSHYGYALELFADCTFRTLASHRVGAAYKSSGVLVDVPRLRPEDFAAYDNSHNYDHAIEQLEAAAAQAIAAHESES